MENVSLFFIDYSKDLIQMIIICHHESSNYIVENIMLTWFKDDS